jgi:hypothetical protein
MRYFLIGILVLIGLLFSFVWEDSSSSNTKIEAPPKCKSPVQSGLLVNKMNGMSFVAPPNPFPSDPMEELSTLGVGWIASLPYAIFQKNKPTFNRVVSGGWWGEGSDGMYKTIELAHEQGLKVMLKPQLWTHGQWIGNLDFKTNKEWELFEVSYSKFILYWATVADSMDVELFCIGTEIQHSTDKRPNYWRNLIDDIREIYKGKLTYAPNWDDYEKVTFWDKLDYIGTDAYFPLLPDKTPSVCNLKDAWQPILKKLKAFSEKWNKPVLFTEFGYLSLDGCAFKTWELEKDRRSVDINEQAQSNAVQALLEVFAEEKWWAGGFLWKWYPNLNSAAGEGKRARDYTPQGKLLEKVLKKMYED